MKLDFLRCHGHTGVANSQKSNKSQGKDAKSLFVTGVPIILFFTPKSLEIWTSLYINLSNKNEEKYHIGFRKVTDALIIVGLKTAFPTLQRIKCSSTSIFICGCNPWES